MSIPFSRVPIRKELERPWPVRGETIEWKGKCFFNPDLIKQILSSTLPGVLHEKRQLLPLIDAETAEVLPNTKITLDSMIDHSRPIYKGQIGEKTVLVKLHPMPVDFDSKSPWAGLKTVNSVHPLQLDVLREARAYEKLEHLQGSIVPYCYGFYVVRPLSSAVLKFQPAELY